MNTNDATELNATSTSVARSENQQIVPAPKHYPFNRSLFQEMRFTYKNTHSISSFLEKYKNTDNPPATVLQSKEDLFHSLSPTEAAEWLRVAKEHDLPSKDLFAMSDPEALASLEDDEADEGSKKPAAVERPTATAVSFSTEHMEPSTAMLNFQKSFTLLSKEEQASLLHQVTPSTAGHPAARLWSTAGTPHSNLWRDPANDANISSISDISASTSDQGHFLQQTPLPPDFQQYTSTAPSIKAAATSNIDFNIDPLETIMSSPQLTIYKELIKDLASSSIAATDALQQKTSAAEKLHDPMINPTPRSIRNNTFTLTTIAEFRDHATFKALQMKAAGIVEQYRENLAATIRELATNEILWLKLLRIQKIVQKLKPIIASLVFKLDHITKRPSLPELATQDTIHFFMFYWLIQMNTKAKRRCYSTFFGVPTNDIAATAAAILIENNPLAVGLIVENLNHDSMNWDTNNQATGYYVNTILRDLDTIFNAAVFDYVTYHQTQKNAKKIDAEVQAFVNKLRVKNTTVLTNETLAKVAKKVKTDNINEQDLRRRQLALEAIIAKQNERINHLVKEQKNSHGSNSAQRPSQLESKPPIIGHPKWQPATKAMHQSAPPYIPTPQAPVTTETNKATSATNQQKQQKKKRKFLQKK